MYEFKVNDNIYNVRFGYGVLCKSDLLDRVMNANGTGTEKEEPSDTVKRVIGLTAELLLEGLQKKHKKEFGYSNSQEREEKLAAVYDLLDDYEDENTDEDGNHVKDGFTLFGDLQEELVKNGFLSRLMSEAQAIEEMEQETKRAPKIPQDHLKKKAGAKQ